ncbi:hypothetical protein BDN70DRAFT_831660 [Pholiota conissans]|uniref:Uncharacterized protein n=1 Tax=Pholiota conissans TaxID=109636 RepID=A0A9P5Z6E2_9AGAR|nr:hypothetical protein BDN70DRAFT_831660 [Pholiota conissans]
MLNVSAIRTALKTSRSAFRPALGAQIAPALIRGVHTTPATAQQQEKEKLTHTSDTYAKEVDSTPAADNTVHRVDPDSDRVQKPYEPPSGYSRAGVQYEEYRHVEGRKQPYAPEGGSKGNYGARPDWAEQKGPETSGPEESPNEKSSGGRQ